MNTTSKKWYKPTEIADQELIVNSKGKGDRQFILKLINTGILKAKNYSRGSKPYYLVPQDEIDRYHNTLNDVE